MPNDPLPLAGLDLNLLVILRALLREQGVTRAADQLRSTQPTVSRALKTLRVAFADPLLVRSGRGMALTPLARQLRTPVERALAALDRLTDLGSFDPKTAQRTFRIIMPDVIGTQVIAALAHAQQSAPGISFQVMGSEKFALRGLLDDTIDLVYGGSLPEHPELYTRRAGPPLRLHVLYGPSHPNWQSSMTQQAYLASDHVQLVPGEQPTVKSAFDRALNRAGYTRRIRMHVAYLAAIGPILEHTAFVASLPEQAARWVAQGHSLRIAPHPFVDLFQTPPRVWLTWHHTHHDDAGHRWLRERIAEAAM